MQIATSYFYQIRNFKKNMIPVSTCLSDPKWYKPPKGQEYYIDKRGIVCGLRYEPLIVQRYCTYECYEKVNICSIARDEKYACALMAEYRKLLDTVDFNRIIKAFNYCANKFNNNFNEESIIVLIVYENESNPCSERKALQDYFISHGVNCKELIYPIQ